MSDAWYYADRHGQVGPFTLQELRETLTTFATANACDLLFWHRGFPDWKPAKDVAELNVLTPLAPPVPGNFTRDGAEERPAESKSPGPAVPAKANDARGDELARLRILEKLALRSENGNVPLPFLMRVLVATATNTASQSPACIVLPDVEGIAELVAAIVSIEKLREDWPSLKGSFIKDALRPEISLRSVADGKVIGFDGIEQSNGQEWVSLRYSDAEGRRTQGKLIVQREVIFGLEPTERKRPFLKSGEKPDDPTPTPFDVVADARTCGNTHLIRNRVIQEYRAGIIRQFAAADHRRSAFLRNAD